MCYLTSTVLVSLKSVQSCRVNSISWVTAEQMCETHRDAEGLTGRDAYWESKCETSDFLEFKQV